MFQVWSPRQVLRKCSTKRGVREPLHVEFALKNRESAKTEVFEKRVFEQTAPIKMSKMKGHFP